MGFSRPVKPKSKSGSSQKPKTQPKEVQDESGSASDSDLVPHEDELEVSSPEVLETGDQDDQIDGSSEESNSHGSESSSDDEEGSSDAEEDSAVDEDELIKRKLADVSFGALSKARDALNSAGNGKKRKRDGEANDESAKKLEDLRSRLRELREAQGIRSSEQSTMKRARTQDRSGEKRGKGLSHNAAEEDPDSAKSSDAEKDDSNTPKKKSRSSKHAPTEQSSKRAVPRRRTIIETATPALGDPRFAHFTGRLNEAGVTQRYAFLEQYRATELAELRGALRDAPKTRMPEDERARVKRDVQALESRAQTRDAAAREKQIVREHRAADREARAATGKQPFYLKRSDVRRQVLTERFEALKGKGKDRAIERRRKKLAAQERKHMPETRRT